AVLAPHDRVHRQLEVVGLASEDRTDRVRFLVGQSEGAVHLGFVHAVHHTIGPMDERTGQPGGLTSEHKEALALGREQSRVVKRYLEALEERRPRRGRRRTAESVRKQLAAIEERLSEADPLTRLRLLQDRIDLQKEVESTAGDVDITALEEEFVKVARSYSERKGISYAAWREIGVDAPVLKRAGIRRAGS